MASTQQLKRRIGSVKNTKQITKAMELVAASKMRRAQEYAAHGRVYRRAAYSLLARLSRVTEVADHPLFVKRPVKTRLYLAISSNRGLAGAYNSNIIRLLAKSALQDQKDGIQTKVISVGKQAGRFARRLESIDLIGAYDNFGDHPTANDVRPLLSSLVSEYSQKRVDEIVLLYTDFRTNLLQVATSLTLLPAKFDPSNPDELDAVPASEKANQLDSVTFEPSVGAVLDNVATRLLEVQLWQALLESIASEHSMRMMAMKNATDNATDLIDDLTLEYNTARQAAITQELAEITGGAEAMK